MKMIEVKSITKTYGSIRVLRDVSLEVKKSQVVALIGPSGAGKSTLLRCIAGLESINDGQIYIEGNKLGTDKTRRKTGMVFQNFNLFPQKTALENIILAPVIVEKIPKYEAVLRAETVLLKVGLIDQKNKYPSELSGGQQQRVAIARALAMNPDILLFDEPTSALDPELVSEVLRVIKKLADEKMTIIIASHEMGFVRQVADTVVFMDRGKIVETGTPRTVIDSGTNPRITAFFERITNYL